MTAYLIQIIRNVSSSKYYFATNLQGDVIQLVDGTGAAVAVYEYDPYGNIVFQSGNLADLNPLRYRGYYYDAETGFYYLQSRYYDPQLGRFLNPDVVFDYDVGIPGYNLFTYCGNSPVFRVDISGKDSIDLSNEDDVLPTKDAKEGGAGAHITTYVVGESSGQGNSGGNTSQRTNSGTSQASSSSCTRIGGGHGNPIHAKRIDKLMTTLIKSGKYLRVYGNRALSTAGLRGSQRPDIIAEGTNGSFEVWEIASPSQSAGTYGHLRLQEKIDLMYAMNPDVEFHPIVPWEIKIVQSIIW